MCVGNAKASHNLGAVRYPPPLIRTNTILTLVLKPKEYLCIPTIDDTRNGIAQVGATPLEKVNIVYNSLIGIKIFLESSNFEEFYSISPF